jgi:hypothetical protein
MADPIEQAKPLTDAEVDEIMRRISRCDQKVITDIFEEFCNTLNSIIILVLKQLKDEREIVQLEQLRRVLNITPAFEKFIRAKDKVWAVRNHIVNKNAKYFLEKDYSSLIKKDSRQTFIESLMEIVRDNFEPLSDSEKDLYWRKASRLLNCVARFKQLTD